MTEVDFKIEKGVPLPSGHGTKGSPRLPYGQMKVGDSIFVPADGRKSPQANILHSAKSWAVYNNKPWQFATRKEGDGIRIWRTA